MKKKKKTDEDDKPTTLNIKSKLFIYIFNFSVQNKWSKDNFMWFDICLMGIYFSFSLFISGWIYSSTLIESV